MLNIPLLEVTMKQDNLSNINNNQAKTTFDSNSDISDNDFNSFLFKDSNLDSIKIEQFVTNENLNIIAKPDNIKSYLSTKLVESNNDFSELDSAEESNLNNFNTPLNFLDSLNTNFVSEFESEDNSCINEFNSKITEVIDTPEMISKNINCISDKDTSYIINDIVYDLNELSSVNEDILSDLTSPELTENLSNIFLKDISFSKVNDTIMNKISNSTIDTNTNLAILNETLVAEKQINQTENLFIDTVDYSIDFEQDSNKELDDLFTYSLNKISFFESGEDVVENELTLSKYSTTDEEIFNQIREGMTALSGSKRIRLQLKPQGLGCVGVNVQLLNGKLNLTFTVDNSAVEDVLISNLSHLETLLSVSGALSASDIVIKKRDDSKTSLFLKSKNFMKDKSFTSVDLIDEL